MFQLAAALPPVAILVFAAGSLLLRQRHKAKTIQEKDELHEPVVRTEVVKLKAKQPRKKSRVSSRDAERQGKEPSEEQLPELPFLSAEAPKPQREKLSSSPASVFEESDKSSPNGAWTTVTKKTRTSRASTGFADAKAAPTQVTRETSGNAAVEPKQQKQSLSTSSIEDASARAEAKWFTHEDNLPVSHTPEVVPKTEDLKNTYEAAQCAKEGHSKRKCSACLQQSLAAAPAPNLLPKSRPSKSWAAVTAEKQAETGQPVPPFPTDSQLTKAEDYASFPSVNRASEFGAVGDRMLPSSYHAVIPAIESSSNPLKASDLLVDSAFSSPRSIGSASPRSDTSNFGGLSEEDEHSRKSSAAELEYIARQNLTDSTDPVNDLKTLHHRLDSSDWLEVAEALNNLRALVLYHAGLTESVLPSVAPQILKAMKNPRSALQKTAIMALTDAFASLGDKTLPWVGLLLLELFLKSSQDKKFVCDTADEALRVMTVNLSPAPLLEKLLPFTTHKSQRVRARAIGAVYGSLVRMNLDEIVLFGHERLLKAAKRLQTDKQPEARDAARKMRELLESQGKIAPLDA